MKRCILIPVLLITAFVLCSTAAAPERRLTPSEIEALREQYPIYGDLNKIKLDGLWSKPSLERSIGYSESVVCVEVTGDIRHFRERLKYYYEYPVTVIADTEGVFKKGEQITFYSRREYIDYNPTLSKGMKIVAPVERDKKVSTRVGFDVNGMYYVTDAGHAISAYEENDIILSGIPVRDLMKKMQYLSKG